MSLDTIPDASGHAITVGCLVYIVRALMEEMRKWRPGAKNEATHADLELINYKLEEMKKENTYNVNWRHWMGQQMQTLMSHNDLKCDPMPERCD